MTHLAVLILSCCSLFPPQDTIPPAHKTVVKDTMTMEGMDMDSTAMAQMGNMGQMDMPGGVLLTVPMSQEGSGTSWQPAVSPLYMKEYDTDDWSYMLHGAIFPRFTHQGGPRGDHQIDAPNWIMGMAQHLLDDNDEISFRIMMSLDRLTEGGDGYPLLLQTGETWDGSPLIDRQHPHDFLSEVSAIFNHKLAQGLAGFAYLGYPGEPALGPPAFMHRLSAMGDPDAPISHHWQDATHITFGVATLGLAYKQIKLEGSIFNGREPDENRFNFDTLRLDSYSGRVSYNPSREMALQASTSFINNPEGDGIDVHRTTASMIHTHMFDVNEWQSTTFVWGENYSPDHFRLESALFETAYSFSENLLYLRLEYVEKLETELGIADSLNPYAKVQLNECTIGYNGTMKKLGGLDFNLGGQLTLYSSLPTQYGSSPVSYELVLSIHPEEMK